MSNCRPSNLQKHKKHETTQKNLHVPLLANKTSAWTFNNYGYVKNLSECAMEKWEHWLKSWLSAASIGGTIAPLFSIWTSETESSTKIYAYIHIHMRMRGWVARIGDFLQWPLRTPSSPFFKYLSWIPRVHSYPKFSVCFDLVGHPSNRYKSSNQKKPLNLFPLDRWPNQN